MPAGNEMKKLFFQVIGLLVLLGAGFGLAQLKSAIPFAAGPTKDPLVSQSYVEQALDSRLEQLESRMAALKARVQELERKAIR